MLQHDYLNIDQSRIQRGSHDLPPSRQKIKKDKFLHRNKKKSNKPCGRKHVMHTFF